MKRLILSTVFIFCLGCASSGTYHSNWHYDDKAEMNRLDPDENISMVYVPIYSSNPNEMTLLSLLMDLFGDENGGS